MKDFSGFTDNNLIGEIHRLEDEVRLLSERLREAEKGKTEFLSNVRNEINNPLTSILGLSESIGSLTNDEKLLKVGNLIHLAAFELDFQIRNIIAAAEIESGELAPDVSRVDVRSLIENQISYLQPRLRSSSISLSIDSPDVQFRTDPYLLQVVLLNLLANAIEFTSVDGKVAVSVKLVDQELCIEIQDNGIGINADHQKRIFERFHQLNRGTTKEHKGHGLGLAIVKEFISALSALIEFDSQQHVGTTVRMRFPELGVESEFGGISRFGNETMFTDGAEF